MEPLERVPQGPHAPQGFAGGARRRNDIAVHGRASASGALGRGRRKAQGP